MTHAAIDYDYYLNALKPDGEVWVVGSNSVQSGFSSSLLNDWSERSIRGSYIGSLADLGDLMRLAAVSSIRSNVHVMPMSQLNEALQLVAGSNQSAFRIVVTND